MAHPYTTEANLKKLVGTNLLSALTTLDGSTTAADVLAQAIEGADSEIDAALALRYAVPFASLTDTPSVITMISNHLAASFLYLKRHPEGEDHKVHRSIAERMLARLMDGTYSVPGATSAAADEARMGVSWSSSGPEPTFAGHDEDGDDRMNSW